ncbi:MAG: dihydropteroate synthase [Desulfobacteraceae bacterium]|nr:dihydropteroate synthase [Desulfobacteraceae bacterium]
MTDFQKFLDTGFKQFMLIIGEKINASIPSVRSIIQQRDEDILVNLSQAQANAGASHIDVNVGTGLGSQDDEISDITWAIDTIQQKVEIPISIDSADPAVLEAGLKVRNGRQSIINSTKAEDESLIKILPLAVHYQTPIVALAMDQQGIPKTVEDRLQASQKVAAACQKSGLPLEMVFFDPLVIPVSTDVKQGLITLETLSAIKKAFPMAKTVIGLSNVSYGLPERTRLNAAFLHMATFAGLDAVIIDPLIEELMGAVKTVEVLVGRDRHCRRYTRAFRK